MWGKLSKLDYIIPRQNQFIEPMGICDHISVVFLSNFPTNCILFSSSNKKLLVLEFYFGMEVPGARALLVRDASGWLASQLPTSYLVPTHYATMPTLLLHTT